jgi:FtsP/CotA-like multicopper oxidase with cupredoxin domain
MSATRRNRLSRRIPFLLGLLLLAGAMPAMAQSFRVQCPTQTALHPTASSEANPVGGQIKCQHIAGSDGYATMADGNQIYLFGFAPLSGQADLLKGLPGTQPAAVFNAPFNLVGVNDASKAPNNSGIVEPRQIMDTGVLFANEPAPMLAIDEDDELYLTLSNVGMIMRPDLFEQHTVHFHGYPQASSYFDGVPDASVAINIAGSFTYYYTSPDAGTYLWHCHITPPEHLQMGMVGQLFVRPRQNRAIAGATLPSPTCGSGDGVMCNTPVPNAATDPAATTFLHQAGYRYVYNDGDGSTRYDVEVPLQLMGFDPNFHFVGMTFNPESFSTMKDKYFLLSGRSYPDTVGGDNLGTLDTLGRDTNPGSLSTWSVDSVQRAAQPQPALITLDQSGCSTTGAKVPGANCQTVALLRISDVNVTEYHTLATVGIPMTVVGYHARLLRDLAGNNLYYKTNSITVGGGESLDVLLDASAPEYKSGQTYFVYTTNLDHLSNDAENFGGMMTEIRIL